MLSGQVVGVLGFVLVLALLVTGMWAIVSGTWKWFLYLAQLLGALCVLFVVWQSIHLGMDTLGRYPVAAQIISADLGDSTANFQAIGERRPALEKSSFSVVYCYVVDGQQHCGERYSTVDIYLSQHEASAKLEAFADGPLTAYIARWNVDDAILDRAIGSRAMAICLAAFAALVLLGLAGRLAR